MMTIALYWLIIGLALIIVEIAIPGLFVFMFFALGAFVLSALTYLSPVNPTIQAVIFFVVSLGGLLLFRGYLKDNFFTEKHPPEDHMLEEVKGKRVTAVKDFVSGKGRVTFNGAPWDAIANGVEVKKSDILTIVGKDNITLLVELVKE